MIKKLTILFFCLVIFCSYNNVFAQNKIILDTSKTINVAKKIISLKDTGVKKYDPSIAIKRSAMLPGWGQYTNKKYWKIPIVYAALGTTGYLFFRNLKQYREAKNAFILASDTNVANDILIPEPYYSVRLQPDRIRVFRNGVRQNVDYSVLFFIVFWGLNVADAAVDANLKTFDVSDDLSIRIRAGKSDLGNTNGLSISLVPAIASSKKGAINPMTFTKF